MDLMREARLLSDDDAADNFESFLKKRKVKRSLLTRLHTTVTSPRTITKADATVFKKKVLSYQIDLNAINADLSAMASVKDFWTEDEVLSQEEQLDLYNDTILFIEAVMDLIINESVPSSSTAIHPNVSSRSTLPKIDLPHFSGKVEEYRKFITDFTGLINRHNLDPIEKFHYLLQSVSGDAKLLLSSIGSTNMNYTFAVNLLEEAFCDLVEQQFAVLRNLDKLKLGPKTPSMTWVGEARVICDQFRMLNIDTDTVLQFKLWESLDDDFRAELRLLTNKSKPTITQIIDNCFEANKRYIDAHKNQIEYEGYRYFFIYKGV
jgi:hypothetical protein